MGHVVRQPLLTTILVPCYVVKSLELFWRSGTRRWRLSDLQMSCNDLTYRQGIRTVMPLMAVGMTCASGTSHRPLYCNDPKLTRTARTLCRPGDHFTNVIQIRRTFMGASHSESDVTGRHVTGSHVTGSDVKTTTTDTIKNAYTLLMCLLSKVWYNAYYFIKFQTTQPGYNFVWICDGSSKIITCFDHCAQRQNTVQQIWIMCPWNVCEMAPKVGRMNKAANNSHLSYWT